MAERTTEEGIFLADGVVQASEIEEGHFLTGLDNGYVIEVEEVGHYDDEVKITFNTADGGEGYLTVPKNMPLQATKNPNGGS